LGQRHRVWVLLVGWTAQIDQRVWEAMQGLVGFATDFEGNLTLWHRYLEISRVLRRKANGSLELLDGASFVYGGDVVDHLPGDLQILEELVALKQRYPERVHLLLGNRDINKLRLPTELSEVHRCAWPLREHPGVYWSESRPAETLSEVALAQDSPSARLSWILRETMGAPGAFESRRDELSRRAGGGPVGDEEVVRSFAEYARPGGALFKYLHCGRLAVRVGRTLFVHAGLPRSGDHWMPGWVPGPPACSGLPLDEWLATLDALRASALGRVAAAEEAGEPAVADAWSMRGQGGYGHPQPAASLLQYGMRDCPDGTRQPSVIYNGWLDDEYQPTLAPDAATVAWLREAGVQRVVCGHQPHGDAPLVLRLAGGIDVVTADITYARETLWLGAQAKGDEMSECPACCEVLLGPGDGEGRVHGVLSNGQAFEASLEDPLIGSITADGWRVKARTQAHNGEGGQLVLMSRNEKYTFENRLCPEEAVVVVR